MFAAKELLLVVAVMAVAANSQFFGQGRRPFTAFTAFRQVLSAVTVVTRQ